MSERPKKPDSVVAYEEFVRKGPPRCCHTCGDYNEHGECLRFNSVPPEGFAATEGACADWVYEVPF